MPGERTNSCHKIRAHSVLKNWARGAVLKKIAFFGWDEKDDAEEASVKDMFDRTDTDGSGKLCASTTQPFWFLHAGRAADMKCARARFSQGQTRDPYAV